MLCKYISTFITAASEEAIDDEDWNSWQDEDGMLQHVQDQQGVQICDWFIDCTWDEVPIISLLHLANEDYVGYHDGEGEQPLDSGWPWETLVSAHHIWDSKVALEAIHSIVAAQSNSMILNLEIEP